MGHTDRNVAGLRDALSDADPQVRLNAAIRLAYKGCADGADELVAGLAHPEGAIRLVQVPEALALLGDSGLVHARRLVRHPGRERLAAARALAYGGERDGVIDAVQAALAGSDLADMYEATALVGELGTAAGECFDVLAAAAGRHGGSMPILLTALAAADGQRAIPHLSRGLDADNEAVRIAAIRGFMGLGRSASSTADRLAVVMRDRSLGLRERMTSAQALTRVGPAGDGVADELLAALPDADRWLRIALLRALGQLSPRYPRRPEVSEEWPLWESRFIHSEPPCRVTAVDPLLASLVEHLDHDDHDDHDVRRNAALALALYGRAARPAEADVSNVPRLSEALRADVLRMIRRGPRTSPPADDWPWELYMSRLAVNHDAIADACERQWARASGGDLDYRIPVPKWQFLDYLIECRGLLVHGSRTPGLDVLEPRSRSWGGGRTAGQPGVFAVDHALMAMYFAVLDSKRGFNTPNGLYTVRRPDGRRERVFHLAANFAALATRPFIPATVYVLPPETFSMMGELTSLVPVRPLARLAITPADFPLLEYLWGSDLGPLSTQFGAAFPFLRDVGTWPTKRSELSATK